MKHDEKAKRIPPSLLFWQARFPSLLLCFFFLRPSSLLSVSRRRLVVPQRSIVPRLSLTALSRFSTRSGTNGLSLASIPTDRRPWFVLPATKLSKGSLDPPPILLHRSSSASYLFFFCIFFLITDFTLTIYGTGQHRGVTSHFLDTFFARRSIHHRHRRTPIHPSTLTHPHPHQYLNPWMVTSVKGDRGKGTLHRRTPELGILRTRTGTPL